MINCKAAPRGGGSSSSSPTTSRQKQILLRKLLAAHNQTLTTTKKKKLPRQKLLCKVKTEDDLIHVYVGGYYRLRGEEEYSMWKLAHSELGPIFLFSTDDGQTWETQWESDNKDEVKLANTVARALADLETDKMLKGEYDEQRTETSDNP